MRMPGFGEVPATYDAATGRLVYRPISVLRQPEVGVHVRMRRKGQEKDDTVSWKFFIDQKAHYLPRETAAAEGAPAPAVEGGGDTPLATQ
jgi:hypothetical protein